MPTSGDTNDGLSVALEDLLRGQSLTKIVQWENNLFDEQAGPLAKSLVLYGAGGLGRKTMAGLHKLGITPVAFTDNNPALHGQDVDGIPILSPQQAAHHFGKTAVFVITIFMDSAPGGMELLVKKLNQLGCEHVISFAVLYWKYPDLFLPHYVYDLPHKVVENMGKIRAAFALLDDKTSREEFLAQIKWRLDPQFDQIPAPLMEQQIYFPDDLFRLTNNETFIDCGAYTGDTLRAFLKHSDSHFNKIFALEPDPANFEALTGLMKSLPENIARRIKALELALGRRPESLHFNAMGVASSSLSENGKMLIQSETLDRLLLNESPTFIKMDIEGAEIDALHGAAESIRRHIPVLAISVYHRQEHIWEIPLLIDSFIPSYRYYLRRYHPRVLDDLVLYAVPMERLPPNGM